ncbi:hypothetical protein [Clostridium perfringens]|uniref:hypothetical protein n=1 Tax=Clostridium perfringens TaxID=1502 RepID=UPI0024BCD1BC|nr:hypothetical protein [Clostridium perfringens]
MNDINTLIIDNSYIGRTSLKKAIEAFNKNNNAEYTLNLIGEAKNSKEGLDFFKENNIDLVILNINLPNCNAVEFANSLLNDNELKLLIIKPNQFKGDLSEFLNKGNSIIFNRDKDLNKEDLFKKIDFLVSSKSYLENFNNSSVISNNIEQLKTNNQNITSEDIPKASIIENNEIIEEAAPNKTSIIEENDISESSDNNYLIVEDNEQKEDDVTNHSIIEENYIPENSNTDKKVLIIDDDNEVEADISKSQTMEEDYIPESNSNDNELLIIDDEENEDNVSTSSNYKENNITEGSDTDEELLIIDNKENDIPESINNDEELLITENEEIEGNITNNPTIEEIDIPESINNDEELLIIDNEESEDDITNNPTIEENDIPESINNDEELLIIDNEESEDNITNNITIEEDCIPQNINNDEELLIIDRKISEDNESSPMIENDENPFNEKISLENFEIEPLINSYEEQYVEDNNNINHYDKSMTNKGYVDERNLVLSNIDAPSNLNIICESDESSKLLNSENSEYNTKNDFENSIDEEIPDLIPLRPNIKLFEPNRYNNEENESNQIIGGLFSSLKNIIKKK